MCRVSRTRAPRGNPQEALSISVHGTWPFLLSLIRNRRLDNFPANFTVSLPDFLGKYGYFRIQAFEADNVGLFCNFTLPF